MRLLPLLAGLAGMSGASGHAHFCRECADRAAALLSSLPAAIPADTPLPTLDATPPPPPAPVAVRTFPLSEVSLRAGDTTASNLSWAAEHTNMEYLLMLSVDSLAYNFRQTAGLSTEGARPLGGWETPYPSSEGDDRGHFVGHWLSATALAVNSTGNAELKSRATRLVQILGKCQQANSKSQSRFGPGYLSASPVIYFDCLENLWRRPCRYMQVPYYNVHKIMQGLLDQNQLLGNAEAFQILLKMATYFNNRITSLIHRNGTAVWNQVLNTETGGMNDVMYKLYAITRDPKHLRMAHLFDKQTWFAPLINATDVLGGNHANTHLALTVGGANRYGVIEDVEYRHATEFFVQTLRNAHSYSTGGSNFREYWQTAHTQGSSLFNQVAGGHSGFEGRDNEESCTTYNFLKIVRLLFEWSSLPGFMEMYNHALINGVLGIQNPYEPGVMIYLLPLGNGVTKGNSSRSWGTPMNSFWCCYGTAIESFSKLADSIYFQQRINSTFTTNANSIAAARSQAPMSLLLTRFADSVVQPTAGTIGLSQVVRVTPNAIASVMTVTQSATTVGNQGSLRLLVPSWTENEYAGIKLLPPIVNGKMLKTPVVTPGQFLTVTPRPSGWQTGDTIKMEFPCPLKLRKLDDNRTAYESMYSFVVGDVLLVGLESEPGAPNSLIVPSADSLTNLTSWVRVSKASTVSMPLRFVANVRGRTGGDELHLMPLNEVVHERYTVYYNISVQPR